MKEESDQKEIENLIKLLEDKNNYLQERERDLADKTEELLAQKDMLTAAIEEVMLKNDSLNKTLMTLRDRNFEMDQILYRTSHDLRSPLSSIWGILELAKAEPQSASMKEYQLHIGNKVDQMDNLLRSLSSLSKAILEETSYCLVSLRSIIQQVIEELKYLPTWPNVVVTQNLHEKEFKTDVFLINIVLQSVLSNAYIFRDQSKAGIIHINSLQQNSEVLIEVIDDGDGIPETIANQIFDMFYRGSEKSKGSGLGLYVAKKALEKLNGSITQISNKNKTQFTITLPLLN
jgi:signal transduction histidine kinase